jgi:UDP-glucose 4-epimerase
MILITGGAGYIGSHFAQLYARERPQQEALVVDDLSRGHKEALAGLPSIKFEQVDIGDQESLERIFLRYPIDAVVHFAASAYVGESQSDPFQYFSNNVNNSLSFFSSLEKHNIKKIVFSSTCATYGNPLYLPIDEAHPQKPVNVYGTTKLMIELALRALAESSGWSSICLRYFNAAGASADGLIGESHEPEPHLLPNILRAASGKASAVTINGADYDTIDGTCVRDYIHVEDLAWAHLKALDQLSNEGNMGARAFNLGSDTGATILEMVRICEAVTGKSISTEIGPRRPGDPPSLVANSASAKSELGWQPKFTLEETISTAWKWEKQRRF